MLIPVTNAINAFPYGLALLFSHVVNSFISCSLRNRPYNLYTYRGIDWNDTVLIIHVCQPLKNRKSYLMTENKHKKTIPLHR